MALSIILAIAPFDMEERLHLIAPLCTDERLRVIAPLCTDERLRVIAPLCTDERLRRHLSYSPYRRAALVGPALRWELRLCDILSPSPHRGAALAHLYVGGAS